MEQLEWRDFFVSYTASDEPLAKWVTEKLSVLGFKVHVQYLAASDNFILWIENAVTHSRHFIVVYSSHYKQKCNEAGSWCRHEIDMALKEKTRREQQCEPEMRILVVRGDEGEVIPSISAFQRVDLYTLNDDDSSREEQAYGMLRAAIYAIKKSPLPSLHTSHNSKGRETTPTSPFHKAKSSGETVSTPQWRSDLDDISGLLDLYSTNLRDAYIALQKSHTYEECSKAIRDITACIESIIIAIQAIYYRKIYVASEDECENILKDFESQVLRYILTFRPKSESFPQDNLAEIRLGFHETGFWIHFVLEIILAQIKLLNDFLGRSQGKNSDKLYILQESLERKKSDNQRKYMDFYNRLSRSPENMLSQNSDVGSMSL